MEHHNPLHLRSDSWSRDVVVQLLLARAAPGKPCTALGLVPGQHAILQVHALFGMLCTLRTCRALTLCASAERHNSFTSAAAAPTELGIYLLSKVAIDNLEHHEVSITRRGSIRKPVCVQGHTRVAEVLQAAHLAGAARMAAELPARLITECWRPGAEPALQLADSSNWRWPPRNRIDLKEYSVAWATRVLAEHGAASAGTCGARQGAPAPAPACEQSLPRTDALASTAWPGLADAVVALVLRSVSARRVLA